MHTQSLRLLACTAALSLTLPLGAKVLMLDFGGTTVSGADLTNSPYHSVNTGFTDGTWNKQAISNDNTLVWSDGTTATGVSYNALKNGASGGTVIVKGGWLTSGGVTGSTVNTGIYAGTSVGMDGHLFSTTLTDNRAVGIQVFGLEFGTYDIYVSGRNTNYDATAYSMNFFASASAETTATATSGTGSAGTKLDLSSGFVTETNTFNDASHNTTSWMFTSGDDENSNYAKLTVTLTAENPLLNVIAMGDLGAEMAQGVFNSIQIVAIPEPSSFALLGGAAGMFAAVGLRRRRKN